MENSNEEVLRAVATGMDKWWMVSFPDAQAPRVAAIIEKDNAKDGAKLKHTPATDYGGVADRMFWPMKGRDIAKSVASGIDVHFALLRNDQPLMFNTRDEVEDYNQDNWDDFMWTPGSDD